MLARMRRCGLSGSADMADRARRAAVSCGCSGVRCGVAGGLGFGITYSPSGTEADGMVAGAGPTVPPAVAVIGLMLVGVGGFSGSTPVTLSIVMVAPGSPLPSGAPAVAVRAAPCRRRR